MKLLGRETGTCALTSRNGLIEALPERRPANSEERQRLFVRHRWEVVGPKPL